MIHQSIIRPVRKQVEHCAIGHRKKRVKKILKCPLPLKISEFNCIEKVVFSNRLGNESCTNP